MKNKTVKALAMMMTMCMLGNSAASAAEFSSDTFSAGEAAVQTIPETNPSADTGNSVDAASAVQQNGTDEISDDGSTEAFSTQEEENPFSDADQQEEFSDATETEEIPEAEDPGSIDATLSARYKNAVVEAQIEADPTVKTNCKVYDAANLECQDYSTFGTRVASYLTTSPDGNITRVQFGAIDGKILVEYYDTSYNILRTVTVPLALPEYGAFYESGDNYYVLTGQKNPNHNDSVEVYRVTKYSKDWKVQGAASLYGENTASPFSFGSGRMTMAGNFLYVRTCHVMYGGHQANVSFSVNTDAMTVEDKFTGIFNADNGYISHSFNQFVQIDQGNMVTLDQCDAYPARALVLLKYNTDLSNGKYIPSYPSVCDQTYVMQVGGNTGDNYTGTSAGGFEYSDSCWLVAGNFDTDGAGSSRNIFVAAVPKDGGETVVRYFSNYAGTDNSASTPRLVKTGSNSFVLMWSSQGKVYYTALDGSGQQTGTTHSMDGNLSDCQPTVINGKISWYTWKQNVNVFYEINASDLSDVNAVKIVNGHKYSYGTEVTDGMISRTCTVCGQDQGKVAVPVSLDPIYEKENGGLAYLKGNISLDPGVTYSVECGANFTASGERLYDCEVISSDSDVVSVNMKGTSSADITVHKSGTATLTLKSKYNPAATTTVNISAGVLDSQQYSIKLSKNSFVYDGTEHKPEAKLYKNGKEVSSDNYDVDYKGDLVNVGTVDVVVKGKGGIEGTLTKTFAIVPADFSKCQLTMSEKPIYFYENKEYVPEFTIKDGDKLLTEGKDFTATYRYNNRPGHAQAIFTGKGNYSSSRLSEQFFINARNLEYCDITLAGDSFTSTGKKIEPEVTIKFGEKTLQKNKDFTVAYVNNTDPGTARVIISGKGSYEGHAEKTFTIVKGTEKDDTDKKDDTNRNDDTNNVKKDDTNKKDDTDKKDDIDKKDDTDKKDDVDKKDNTDKKDDADKKDDTNKKDDTVKDNPDDKNNNTDKEDPGNTETPGEKEDDTQKYNLNDCDIEVLDENFVYDGRRKEPKVIVSHNGETLVEGQDYTLTYDRNLNAGRAAVIVHGKGKYTDFVYKTFQIAQAKADVGETSGTLIVGSILYISGLAETDGKITCKSSDTKTMKMSGNNLIALKPGKVTLTVSAKQGKNYSALAKTKITVTIIPSHVRRFTVKSNAKGQIKVSWNPVESTNDISGYEIQYYDSKIKYPKNPKKATAKKTAKTTTIKKLTSGKTYSVHIRTYKIVKGKKYYSVWTSVKNVKVK